jgi:hypothetical protein
MPFNPLVFSYSLPFSLFYMSIYFFYKHSEQWSMSNILNLRSVWVFNLVFRDTTVDLKSSTCTRYALFAVILFAVKPARSLFSMFTADSNYVQLWTLSKLK